MEKNRELEKKVEQWYKWRTGKIINLSNPKTFNEKINWLKVYDSTELKGWLADKYKSRKILEKLLDKDYSIPIIGVWNSFDEIDFNKLPNKFVLKTTHGSAMNIVVKDKSKFNKKEAKDNFDKWLKTDFGSISHEYHYKYIKPRIIAEEYVGNGEDLNECKVHCFNGEAKVIKIIQRDLVDKKSYEAFYDKNWERTSCMYTSFEQIKGEIEKPKCIDEIIKISEKLGSLFKFVRVDFYLLEDKFYLGELTFTPCAGVGGWKNESDNLLAGSWINLKEN